MPEDAPACAAILNDWIDATGWMPRVHPHEDVRRHMREVVFAERQVWVCSRPAGAFLALADDGFITALYSAHPGRGRGKALLEHVKRERSYLQLWTFVADTGARRFYAREGFAEVARTDGDNEEGLADIRFEWKAAA